MTLGPHPSSYQDLVLSDFWLRPKVKMIMNGKGFQSIWAIRHQGQGN